MFSKYKASFLASLIIIPQILAVLLLPTIPTPVYAAEECNNPAINKSTCRISADCGTTTTPPCIEENKIITDIINPAIKLITILVGVIAVIMLIVGGIIYTSSQDDPKRVALARKIILDVVIGIAAYILLFAFLNYILPQGVKGG